jgi:peptide/nickel transport system ATP-binding protein
VMYLGQLIEIGPAEMVFKPPHHPYTEALVSAMPRVDATESAARIRLLGGSQAPPSASATPAGCRFSPRCPRVLGAVCETQDPPWQESSSGHKYRCHIPPTELSALQSGEHPAK